MQALKKAGDIATLIGAFFVGELLNGYLIQYLHGQSILVAALILLITILFAK